ncbi:MAG: UbiX family flavin prenyltransferase [Planctomycetota bacterium]|nr:UbiX family flavin prenyltransferase [Planctomycetota bacterium]MDA1252457.1 UbiX family flavin prenyltransferase [Planctomycetota bacterium]
MKDLVVAITGASGSIYAVRLLEVLLSSGHRVHTVISPSGLTVIEHELGRKVNPASFEQSQLIQEPYGDLDPSRGELLLHRHSDFMTGIASGSFLTGGMVICPCSMGTLAGVAHGMSTNLIQRAADVHLKERRKLIVVPRETPLGSIQLENMKRLADAGAVILPAMPGFYNSPQSIDDLVNFVVARICDQLGVEHSLQKRWGEQAP